VRALSQYHDLPVYVAGSTFTRGVCSNDRSRSLDLRSSALRDNPSDGFETDPGIFFLGRRQTIERSVVR
jgi:hypothetical protein